MKKIILLFLYANFTFAFNYKPKDCTDDLPHGTSLVTMKNKFFIRKEVSSTYHWDYYFTGTDWTMNTSKALSITDSCMLKRIFFASKLN